MNLPSNYNSYYFMLWRRERGADADAADGRRLHAADNAEARRDAPLSLSARASPCQCARR